MKTLRLPHATPIPRQHIHAATPGTGSRKILTYAVMEPYIAVEYDRWKGPSKIIQKISPIVLFWLTLILTILKFSDVYYIGFGIQFNDE